MIPYIAKLEDVKEEKPRTRYTRKQLDHLTTLQLQEICFEQKLVTGIANKLDREEFIAVILRYSGANEEFLIKKYEEEGFAKIQTILEGSLGEKLQPGSPIQNPAKLTIYNGLEILPRDRYIVRTKEEQIRESNVILVDEQNILCGIFYLLSHDEQNDEFVLCMKEEMHKNISHQKSYRLLYFPQIESEYLYEVYTGMQPNLSIPVDYYEVPLPNVYLHELTDTRMTLAIDFGTSNTTAGVFITENYLPNMPEHEILNGQITLNEINLVRFFNPEAGARSWEMIVPTVIGVLDCKSAIRYEFGYEVMQKENYASASNPNSVFYEIKRWIHSYEEKIEIIDYEGNLAAVTRGEIIKAYLDYVIKHAEQQFKCKFRHIHISSPVKLKKQHLTMFQELMEDYEIEMEDSLDEGVAVLYNTIAGQIEKDRFEEGVCYKALIMDCGGGTTDLSSCNFKIEDTHLTYEVEIQTSFENGDTNFGGNNLTYRIMQYLKILFADYYRNGMRTLQLEEVLNVPVGDVYRFIDENGKEALYEELEKKYKEVESEIPTKYQKFRNKSFQDYKRVQGNYHSLWNIAEKIKQSFYKQAGILTVGITAGEGRKADVWILKNQSFRLAVRSNGGLEFIYEIPDLILNIEEITGLLKGDIYHIMKKFLEEFYMDGSLQEFSIIKMTGQSCRIDLFRDAIKEFVPGRSIEFRQKDNYLKDLKLSCLMGAIRYLRDRKTGLIKTKIEHCIPVSPYRVYAKTHHQKDKTLIVCNERINQTCGNISRHSGCEEITFYICDSEENIHAKYSYINDRGSYDSTDYNEINTEYSEYIPQDEVDIIAEGEVKFFVFADELSWGFYVLPILREEGQLHKKNKYFYPFEHEQWELNFFDGTH